jgi:hypothetical protein
MRAALALGRIVIPDLGDAVLAELWLCWDLSRPNRTVFRHRHFPVYPRKITSLRGLM